MFASVSKATASRNIALTLGVVVIAISGCSALLPHEERKVVSRWEDFESAKQDYDRIVPYQTAEAELDELGFSPRRQPNVRILNHADIAQHFLVGSIDGSTLPPGLKDCFTRYSACYGYEVSQRATEGKRYGNFLADFMNFRRKTVTRGWEFSALIVLIEGQVVYKLWSGTPEIHQKHDETNPLGPLQGVGPSLTRPEL
jgi:hypothetical protein